MPAEPLDNAMDLSCDMPSLGTCIRLREAVAAERSSAKKLVFTLIPNNSPPSPRSLRSYMCMPRPTLHPSGLRGRASCLGATIVTFPAPALQIKRFLTILNLPQASKVIPCLRPSAHSHKAFSQRALTVTALYFYPHRALAAAATSCKRTASTWRGRLPWN